MNNKRLQTMIFTPILLCALLFTGMAGAAEQSGSVTAAEARQISQEGFLFGAPLVYIALSAEIQTNVPEPQGPRAPFNQFVEDF